MSWNFDISAAPRDRQILMRTSRDGDKVFVTNWLEPTKHCPNGRFNGFSENAKSLLAWCEIPAFENSPAMANQTMGGTGDDCSFGKSGGWPPQGGASNSRGNDSLSVVTAGETATEFHAKASDDACEAGRKTLGRAEASAEAPDGAELVSRGVGDRTPTATSEDGRDSVERHAPQFILDDCGSGA